MGDHADVAQLVERDLAKVEVAGSSPVVRSKVSGPDWSDTTRFELCAHLLVDPAQRGGDGEHRIVLARM